MSITEAQVRRALRHAEIPWDGEVDDPRESSWVVHDHRGVLGGLAAAFAVGQQNLRRAKDFFADLGLGARRALGLRRGSPCDTTLYRLLAEQSPAGFRLGASTDGTFTRWNTNLPCCTPGFWVVLSNAPHPHTTPGIGPPRPAVWEADRGLQESQLPGHPEHERFRGCFDVAHSLAYLRIAAPVAVERRKAHFRAAGLCPLGRDSRPLDDKPNFGSYRIHFLLPDQTFLVALRSALSRRGGQVTSALRKAFSDQGFSWGRRIERPRFTHGRHRATNISHGVPTIRKTSTQKAVVSAPSR